MCVRSCFSITGGSMGKICRRVVTDSDVHIASSIVGVTDRTQSEIDLMKIYLNSHTSCLMIIRQIKVDIKSWTIHYTYNQLK